MKKIKVLVACEESQRVTLALRRKGFEAYSCDIVPCSGGHPEYHIQRDVIGVLNEKWDMIIAFPPCTYLTVTGNRWFNVERYGEQALKRIENRKEAIQFFLQIASAECERIAIENPIGVMSTTWRKPDQIIQPYMFGDPFEKKTCLWLKGLPLLKPTNVVDVPPRKKFNSGKTMPTWYSEAVKLPKEERSKVRSKTFPGVAEAMAEQWGNILKESENK